MSLEGVETFVKDQVRWQRKTVSFLEGKEAGGLVVSQNRQPSAGKGIWLI